MDNPETKNASDDGSGQDREESGVLEALATADENLALFAALTVIDALVDVVRGQLSRRGSCSSCNCCHDCHSDQETGEEWPPREVLDLIHTLRQTTTLSA